jgi:hypothetical protein
MLDNLQREAFEYFLNATNLSNGLVGDTTRPGSPSSIAVVGFALSAYPVGVERGWIARADAVARILTALQFFEASDQSGGTSASGFRGFYFHFLDMTTGQRVWGSELSSIDTALLIVGMLTAAQYFDGESAEEVRLRMLAERLYFKVDWNWAQREDGALSQGWKPECGFLNYGWDGYDEALLLYILSLGSPTHPLLGTGFEVWTLTYQWENLYGVDFLYAGPLFIHQFSHAWIDFRGIRDRFMREKDCDYFENSRRAVHVQRQYAIRNPRGFEGYGQDRWGLSAGEGPGAPPQSVAGRNQAFYGYAARGAPWGPDDGTIAGSAMLASIVFAPEMTLAAMRGMVQHGSPDPTQALTASGFNKTANPSGEGGWISPGKFGLDQGMIVLMLENFRTGLLWRLLRSCPWIRQGLCAADFRGGWLASPVRD